MTRNAISALFGFLLSVALASAVAAQGGKAKANYVVENGFLGVKLLDPHIRVLEVWGTPTRVEAVQIKERQAGQAAAGGNPFGMVSGGRGGAGLESGGGLATATPGGMGGRGGGGAMGVAPPPSGGMPGPGMIAGAGTSGGGGYDTEVVTNYTRWVYERGDSSYAFLINDENRVTQIDALGIPGSSRYATKGGISLGSSFAQVMRVYKQPDSFHFKGDMMQVRFLTNSHVAFQFQTLDAQQRVVYISVAAGK